MTRHLACGRGALHSGQRCLQGSGIAAAGCRQHRLPVSCAMHQLQQQQQQQHSLQPQFGPFAVAASPQQQQPHHQQQSMLPFGGLCFSRGMASSSRRSRRSGGRGASRSARTAAAGSHANEPSVSTVEQQQQQQQQELTPPPAPAAAAAATDVSGSSSDMMRPVTRPLYSPLHYNILEFAAQVVPTPAERAEKQRVIQCVAVATRRAFESAQGLRVQPFGSFVSGLSVWDSDVDLVVTGLVAPSKLSGGFSNRDKQAVYRALERIASQLRRHKKVSVAKLVIIRTARIPLIKLQTASRVVADISLGDASGPKAANYIAQQVNAHPPLGPLVLVLKVYLRNCGLNEVMNGGLSSFSLTNMVLAHLMEELKDGNDIFDLGEALYGFLLRFGDEFDMRRDAVSVSLGGVVSRWELGHLAAAADGGGGGALAQERLLLEDPLTGRDVASGSYRFQAVQTAFARAARRLEALAQSRGSSSSSSGGGGGPINYLEGLFDVRRALDRQAGLAGLGASPLQQRRGQPLGGNDANDGFSNGRRAQRDDSYHIIGRSSRYPDTAAAAGEGLDDLELTLAGPPGSSSSSSSRGGSWDEAADGFDDEPEALLYPGEPPSRRSRRRRGAGE